jgi:hypothetical protein
MKLAKTTTKPPTLAYALETLAHHVTSIMTYAPNVDVPKVEIGFGLGHGEGCPKVTARVVIRPCHDLKDPWGIWAHCTVNGVDVGNRCGARNALVHTFAPVIAWAAANDAACVAKEGVA